MLLTDFWSAFAPTLEFESHPKLVNQQLLPDLELTLPSGIRALVELDLGTEPLETIRQKNQRYAGACDPQHGPVVVYVTLGKKRLGNLMAVAGPAAKAAYFTTLEHVMREKTTARFLHADGRLVVLYPRT